MDRRGRRRQEVSAVLALRPRSHEVPYRGKKVSPSRSGLVLLPGNFPPSFMESTVRWRGGGGLFYM